MKEVVFIKAKSLTLVFTPNQTFLYDKDNTFAQVIQQLPKELIKSLVKEHGTDKHSKGFNTWSHLVSMIFCQFANCVSLREISNGLRSAGGNLNHHIAFCRNQTAGRIQMALLKSRFIAKTQYIYKKRSVSMDKQTLHTTAGGRIGDIGGGCAVWKRNKNVKSKDGMKIGVSLHKNI